MTVPTLLDAPRTRIGALPAPALAGLFLAGFVGMLTEVLPAGLLPEMGKTLGVSTALTGQTVSVQALGIAMAAIPLTLATATWPRRHVLLLALAIIMVANVLTAVSTSFTFTLVARLVAGLANGLIWSLLGGYASRLAPAGRQGKAIAIALGGIPASLALGLPLGIVLGKVGGWPFAFYAAAGLTGLIMLWILFTLPNLEGKNSCARAKVTDVLVIPGLRPILFVIATYIVAHNILYTYITDFLSHAGIGGQTQWVLLTFGVMAMVSILFVGAHIDRHLRRLAVSCTVVFAVCVLVLAVLSGIPALVYAAAAAWGLSFGSSATLFTTAVINATGESSDVAQSIAFTVFPCAIALGGFLGGLLVAGLGAVVLPWAALILLIAAAAAVIRGKRHTFPQST
ncbi:MFS transporter [Streptomyces sp. NPDC096354]|uniref:MFS transporter n=1 Tax=Streptomyces sp. NPDC096354 TaxID=3366088 RepID=UPI00381C0C73